MKAKIAAVETEIAEVNAKIAAVEKKLKSKEATMESELVFLRSEMKFLRGEKKDLRGKEKDLRGKEKDLRGKEKDLRGAKTELLIEVKQLRIEKRQRPTSAPVAAARDITSAIAPKEVFLSPSKGMGMLLPEYGEFVVRPLFLTSAVADVYASYFAGVFALERSTQVGDEKAMYPFLTSYAPGWVKVQTRDKDADFTVTMRGRRLGGILKRMNLPWTCKPEVATVSDRGHAGFTGEGKSLGTLGGVVVIREVSTYGFFAMSASLFDSEDVLRLYATPPVTYAIVAAGPMAHFMAVEWVGKLFVSPISQPFLLSSPEHQAAVAALPDLDYSDFVDVPLDAPVAEWRTYPPGQSPAQVMWSVVPQGPGRRFLKLIRCTAFDDHPEGGPERLRALHDTYAAYAAAWRGAAAHAAGAAPRALLPALLRYGTFVVAVDMPFLDGRDATPDDLADATGAGARAVAAALVWLARNSLLYVDLRVANVRITPEGDACLVDYDDVRVLNAPLSSAAALEAALADEAAARGFGSFLDAYPGVRAALRDTTLWADAPRA